MNLTGMPRTARPGRVRVVDTSTKGQETRPSLTIKGPSPRFGWREIMAELEGVERSIPVEGQCSRHFAE